MPALYSIYGRFFKDIRGYGDWFFGGGNCVRVLSEDGLENASGNPVWAKSRLLASTTISMRRVFTTASRRVSPTLTNRN